MNKNLELQTAVEITKYDMLSYIKFTKQEQLKNKVIEYKLLKDICVKKGCIMMSMFETPSGEPEFYKRGIDTSFKKGDILIYNPTYRHGFEREENGVFYTHYNVSHDDILLFAFINEFQSLNKTNN